MLFGTYFEFLFLSPEKKTWGIIHYVFVAFLILTTNNFNSQLCAHEKISHCSDSKVEEKAHSGVYEILVIIMVQSDFYLKIY